MRQITKSIFIEHMRCPKAAYNLYHGTGKATESPGNLAKMEGGKRVGLLARELFPGGYDASKGNTLFRNEAVQYTQELIRSGAAIIYEAAFQSDNGLFAFKLDVLVLKEGHVFEVKSTLSVKNEHVLECGYFYSILSELEKKYPNSGLAIKKYSIIHIDKNYVRNDSLDIQSLFTKVDITQRVKKCQKLVSRRLKDTIATLQLSKAPDAVVGEQCDEPYGCAYKEECFHYLKDQDSVLNITGMRAKQKYYLVGRGIYNMRELPSDLKMNAKQILQVETHIQDKIYIDRDWLAEYVGAINTRKLVFMDFETYAEPIPQFKGTKPYQQIPFQYSVHTLHEGKVEHFEFLGEPGTDPREEFIINLIKHVGDEGLIVTYNQAFELSRLRELSEAFPQYSSQILRIIIRVRDLMVPFRQLRMYSPKMRGSYSLKAVMPAFVENLSYANLTINNGSTASAEFLRMAKMSPSDKKIVRARLLEYCKLDTESLVEVWKFIKETVASDRAIVRAIFKSEKQQK